jgi:hypothetical protein
MTQKTYALALICALTIMPIAHAQSISDVPKTDPAYSAISSAVKDGYLSLSSDNSFQGSKPITRRELAIFLDRLVSDTSGTQLTKPQIQELQQLSKSYKNNFLNIDSAVASQNSNITTVMNNTANTYKDLWKINDELKEEIKSMREENERNQLYMWIGIAAAAVTGIIIK